MRLSRSATHAPLLNEAIPLQFNQVRSHGIIREIQRRSQFVYGAIR